MQHLFRLLMTGFQHMGKQIAGVLCLFQSGGQKELPVSGDPAVLQNLFNDRFAQIHIRG